MRLTTSATGSIHGLRHHTTSKASCRQFSWTWHRRAGPKAPDANKRYSDTLLLPKTSFPLYGTRETSEEIFNKKTSDELYRWQVSAAHVRYGE
jgi:hypothetical protein